MSMRTALIALAGVATLSGLATPAAAQSPQDRSDVRCLLVLQLAARDPKARDQAAKGAFYYMGRLGSRGAVSRLDPVMASEARSINSAAAAETELQRCAKELNQGTGQFQALNQRMAATRPAAPATKKP